jgi:molecular chaperone GrpE
MFKKIRNMLEKEKELKDNEIVEEKLEEKHPKEKKKSKDELKKAEKIKYEETINELNAKLSEANDKFLRLYSEFDNYRKRTSKERIELSKTASEDLIVSLLPVIDDFERALKAIEATEENKNLREGVELIYNKMLGILSQKGLKAMESIGKEFNSEIHEAIAQVPSENDENKGKIFDEVVKGYYLHEKVIRHAKVVVSN